MIKLTENLAVETKKHRVKLFAIDPGMIRVGMTRALLEQEIPPDHPAALIANWFRQEMAAGREVPLARGAALVGFLASGRADALSGCYLTVYDDVESLVEEAPSIRRGELYTLRLRER
jgi:NAD(P)-dependent dehydrogenase (short-subunit alcohol dehydrogenase family)